MKLWLQTTGPDGNQHVLYRPERDQHELTTKCPCIPKVRLFVKFVVIHTILTPGAEGVDEKEH